MANYRLIDLAAPATNITLQGVTDDSYVIERDRETLRVIGRAGRKINYGTNWGVIGTLTCKVRESGGVSARTQKTNILAFVAARPQGLNLETPWLDVYKVDIGDITIARVPGTGDSEAVDLTIPYEQIV